MPENNTPVNIMKVLVLRMLPSLVSSMSSLAGDDPGTGADVFGLWEDVTGLRVDDPLTPAVFEKLGCCISVSPAVDVTFSSAADLVVKPALSGESQDGQVAKVSVIVLQLVVPSLTKEVVYVLVSVIVAGESLSVCVTSCVGDSGFGQKVVVFVTVLYRVVPSVTYSVV